MKKILSAALLLASMSINAQETYTNAELATQDLNGDARYVGMGGAMEALGANISAASENPAAMGLFRSNSASVSFGMSNHNAIGNADADSRTVINLDQAGIVFNHRIGYNSYLNWGINYHKSTNFNQIMAVASEGLKYGDITVTNADGSFDSYPVYGSQNGITYEKGGDIVDSQVDKLNYVLLGDQTFSSYDNFLKRDRKGYIANYDFTISGNHHDRIFWGTTITIADVKYKNRTNYQEKILDLGEPNGEVTFEDTHTINGIGANIKAGIIVRPVETSPFRVGLSVESPTWYFLDSESKTHGAHTIYINEDNYKLFPSKANTKCEYSFAITTPWKFGISAGTTFGRNLAVGASFNFTDYSAIKSKIKDENKYDWWKEGKSKTSYNNDKAMNTHTEATLKGVSTLKLGAEYRLTPNVSLRAGYNLETPIYSKDGVRNMFINSPGVETATTTDYTNWQSTNRFTCGAGYSKGKFYADVALQYSTVSGTYLPYQNCSDVILDCYVTPSRPIDLTSKRTQLICTLGYKF